MIYRELLKRPESCKHLNDKSLLLPLLKQAVVFNIDNVAEFFFSVSDKDIWDIATDFPNLAPPFPLFWMEYKMPKTVNVGGDIKELDASKEIYRTGILVEAKEAPPFNDSNCKWGIKLDVISHSVYGIKYMFSQALGIQANGTIGEFQKGKQANLLAFAPYIANSGRSTDYLMTLQNAVYPALLAISFLHCKNVTMIQAGEIKKRKARENREPVTKIYTLEIEPMKKVLKTEGQSEKTGIKQALHICRGHFKDFREGKGLFGKFKNIYWWDSQVRGSSKYGEIKKDYKVNSP